VIRGERVMLDSDLATLYGVEVRRLNEQVRRNQERFPADFTFQLTEEEWGALRSQFATLDAGRGRHRKYAPGATGVSPVFLQPVLVLCTTTIGWSVAS